MIIKSTWYKQYAISVIECNMFVWQPWCVYMLCWNCIVWNETCVCFVGFCFWNDFLIVYLLFHGDHFRNLSGLPVPKRVLVALIDEVVVRCQQHCTGGWRHLKWSVFGPESTHSNFQGIGRALLCALGWPSFPSDQSACANRKKQYFWMRFSYPSHQCVRRDITTTLCVLWHSYTKQY